MTRDRLDLKTLLDCFHRLSDVDDPIEFCVQFETEQKRSALRLSTFRAAWRAWVAQQDKGGTKS